MLTIHLISLCQSTHLHSLTTPSCFVDEENQDTELSNLVVWSLNPGSTNHHITLTFQIKIIELTKS